MSYSHLHTSYSINHLIDNYDFGSIGHGTIVDVGGSHAQVSIAIAQKYPHVKCVVQDLPDTISGLEKRIPENLKDRISGMEYDFLTPQPVQWADIYLFRWIFHDWSDKYCVKILQCLVPALKGGAKIVISDICIPQPGQLGIAADRQLRYVAVLHFHLILSRFRLMCKRLCLRRLMDISMKAFNNARERDAEGWAVLFSKADPRFQFMGITIPPSARMAIILAEWRGE